VNAEGHQGDAFCEGSNFVQRTRSVGKEQADALEFAFSHFQAVFEVAMVVLIGLGVDHDGVVDAGCVHAFEQVFRCGRFGGAVGGAFVIGEAGVRCSGKAMQVGVDPSFANGLCRLFRA